MKREKYNYFEELKKSATFIVESAKIFNETIKKYSKESLKENVKRIHELENKVDDIVHSMERELIKDFLPPIDREDISKIIRNLDDIEDYIDEAIINFDILNITQVEPEVFEFGNLLIDVAITIENMMNELKDYKKNNLIKENIIKINEIEEKADLLYQRGIKRLYLLDDSNSLLIMKWTNIFNCLENTIDTCEHLADNIEDVIMKNL